MMMETDARSGGTCLLASEGKLRRPVYVVRVNANIMISSGVRDVFPATPFRAIVMLN